MDGSILCPYCGEGIDLFIDEGGGSRQDYIEDCEVCCRPMRIRVDVDENGDLCASVQRTDE